MEVLHQRCAGLDVRKAMIVACVRAMAGAKVDHSNRRSHAPPDGGRIESVRPRSGLFLRSAAKGRRGQGKSFSGVQDDVKTWLIVLAVLVSAPLLAVPAIASEDNDLGLIPPAAFAAPTPPPAESSNGRFYVEDAFTANSLRDNLLVSVPSSDRPFDWQNRTSFDGLYEWRLNDSLHFNLSDRLNLLGENDTQFPSREIYRNDFREGYLTWEPAPQIYLEAGRINVRNGVALGFNPTDFFKTRSAVSIASIDPSARREDRLGTAMLRGQWIFGSGSLSVTEAPKLTNPTPLVLTNFPPSLDPGFGKTNGESRLLLTASYDFGHDISPQFLFLRDDAETRYGFDLSRNIGQSIVAYAEWAGGRQQSLAARAEAFEIRTVGIGTGPPPASLPPSLGDGAGFANDLAVGGSWTSENNMTVNLEYHYHQTGLDRAQLRQGFDLGQAGTPSGLDGAFLFLRSYAADQQEPLARQEAFLRIDRTDAFVRDLELSALAFVDLYDGSTLGQITASYNFTNTWTLGAYLIASPGSARSEYGSLPQAESFILQVKYFF
jgi:hypothetical protein